MHARAAAIERAARGCAEPVGTDFLRKQETSKQGLSQNVAKDLVSMIDLRVRDVECDRGQDLAQLCVLHEGCDLRELGRVE